MISFWKYDWLRKKLDANDIKSYIIIFFILNLQSKIVYFLYINSHYAFTRDILGISTGFSFCPSNNLYEI